MVKYVDASVTFAEVPDEISLCIDISNCPNNCEGCHSSYLKEDIGIPLTKEKLDTLIEDNHGITCICIMGGSNDIFSINVLMRHCMEKYPNLKRAIYLGENIPVDGFNFSLFDYIKLGPYVKLLGGLDSPITNQKMFKIINITSKFQKNVTTD